MKPKSIEQQLESLNIHPDEIPDEDISDAINLLFQLIEELHINNEKLKTENQKLRDENNLLKGERNYSAILKTGYRWRKSAYLGLGNTYFSF